jgi:hypothetical protein
VANIDKDGLGALPTVTAVAKAVHRMSAFSQFNSKLLGAATLAGNIEHISSTGVHLLQAGTTAVDAWGVTSGIGEYAAAWPPWWEKLNSVFRGLWYNFEHNTNQEISGMVRVGAGIAGDVQSKIYGYKHFSRGTTSEQLKLILGTVQLTALLAAPEEDPEGLISEGENISREAGGVENEVSEATVGSSKSNDYRITFFKAHPDLRGKVVVHHAIEQQVLTRYPGLFSENEINSLENLRGIPKDANSDLHLSQIRRSWNQFYRTNLHPTRQQILNKATEIDRGFGNYFLPQR